MERTDVERILTEAEQVLAAGGQPDLRALGFWRGVGAVKRDQRLVESYSERIARIDRAAFERAVRVRMPAMVGVGLDVVGLAAGIGLVALSGSALTSVREVAFLVGVGLILGATHTLTHWIVGRAVGIRFTDFFIRLPLPPGLKIDYASYLRASPVARAWMHASGAIISKVVPWAAIPFALGMGLEAWAVWVLLGVGILQLITDATLSTRYSDWKKFRREMLVARQSRRA